MLPVGVQAKLSVVARTRAVMQAILAGDPYEATNFMESSFRIVFGKIGLHSVPRVCGTL